MKDCKAIACYNLISPEDPNDYCNHCLKVPSANDEDVEQDETGTVLHAESSGRNNDYWVASITHPKRLEPYDAECEDLIEHFQMTFQEGEAFKALWRKGQLRLGNGKPGDTHLRNAEKVGHFGDRMEAMELRALECQR